MALDFEGDGNRLYVYDTETKDIIADINDPDNVKHAALFAASEKMLEFIDSLYFRLAVAERTSDRNKADLIYREIGALAQIISRKAKRTD